MAKRVSFQSSIPNSQSLSFISGKSWRKESGESREETESGTLDQFVCLSRPLKVGQVSLGGKVSIFCRHLEVDLEEPSFLTHKCSFWTAGLPGHKYICLMTEKVRPANDQIYRNCCSQSGGRNFQLINEIYVGQLFNVRQRENVRKMRPSWQLIKCN